MESKVGVLALDLASFIALCYKMEAVHKSSHTKVHQDTKHQQLFHDLFNIWFLVQHILVFLHMKKSSNLSRYILKLQNQPKLHFHFHPIKYFLVSYLYIKYLYYEDKLIHIWFDMHRILQLFLEILFRLINDDKVLHLT